MSGDSALGSEEPGCCGAARDSSLTLIDFSQRQAAGSWTPINDAVMGGESQSRILWIPAGFTEFRGTVSFANNGGFASVRGRPANLGRPGVVAYVLQVRGDGKRYKLNMRLDDGYDGVNYQYPFQPTADIWSCCRLASADFCPTWRGRSVIGAPPFDSAKVRQIGLMISDRQEGVFSLAIRAILVDTGERKTTS